MASTGSPMASGGLPWVVSTGSLIKTETKVFHNKKLTSIGKVFCLNEKFSHISTIILIVFTAFCDTKQEAVNFLFKNE